MATWVHDVYDVREASSSYKKPIGKVIYTYIYIYVRIYNGIHFE